MTTHEIMKRVNFFVSGIFLVGIAMLGAFLIQLGVWAADTRVPFQLLAYKVSSVAPGQLAVLDAVVKRDLNRKCSADFSRYFFDSNNTRFDITQGVQHMNSATIEDLDSRNPGELRFLFRVPAEAAPGKGTLVTDLTYMCNPLHLVWPIQYLMKVDMEVK